MAYTTDYYISTYKQTAFNCCYKKGLLVSVLLALAIKESASGNNPLAAIYNNHFCITADKTWIGLTVPFTKDGKTKTYRFYNDPKQSIIDFVETAKDDKDLNRSGVFRKKKPQTQLAALGEGLGYNEDWVNEMLALIEKHELETVEQEAEEQWEKWKKAEEARKS